jgi:hypothetical protein
MNETTYIYCNSANANTEIERTAVAVAATIQLRFRRLVWAKGDKKKAMALGRPHSGCAFA